MPRRTRSRRSFLRVVIGLAAGSAVAACGAPAAPTAAPTAATPAPAKPTEAAKSAEPAKPTEAPKPAAVAEATKPAPAASAPGSAAKVTVKVFSNWTAGPRNDFMKWVKSTYEAENPNTTVELVFTAGSDPFLQRLYTEIAGNTMEDLAMMWGRDACKFMDKGAFLDLTPLMQSSKFGWDLYLKSDPASFILGGKTYGLPHMYTTPCIAANITMFEKAGVGYPKDDWTWNDFLQTAQKLNKPGEQWAYQAPLVGYNPTETWSAWVWGNGGEIISDDRTKSRWDMPETIEAVQWAVDLRNRYKLMPEQSDLKAMQGVGIDPFVGGKVAMLYSNVGGIGNWGTMIKDFKWDLIPFPVSPKGKRVLWNSQSGYYVANNTKYPDESFKVMQLIVGERGMKKVGAIRATMPSFKSAAYDKEGWLKPPPDHINLSVDVIDGGRAQPWSFKKAQEWYDAVIKELDYAALGEKSAAEACKAATAAGDRVLQS